MNPPARLNRITVPDIAARKGRASLVCLTAYTTPMARALDEVVDLLLVGDSLGMVLYGFETTLPVTLEMMIAHGAAVVRGAKRACVVVDLPFGTYQESPEQAFTSAARVMRETGASAVKLEGGVEMAPTIAFLVQRHIPVMGHVGLQPQSVREAGGYRVRGGSHEEAESIRRDARAVQQAGAFALVVEGTWEPVAAQITRDLAIPVIGIGASPECDGQILVTEDMLGLSGFSPKFVKRYAALDGDIATAARAYARDVRSGSFPGLEHCYGTREGQARITPTNPKKSA